MATKTGILATINGFLTAIITQAKVRSASSTIVDEIYPTAVNDTQSTETYTTKSGTSITYDIDIIKSGNIAHIKGTISQSTGGILPVLTGILTWKENEYKPISGDSITFIISNDFDNVKVKLDNTGLSLSSSMPVGIYNFNFQTYITQP